ncbi:MAG: glycerol-3-phosphate dehydrogenase [Gammaproteobacteria bacterium]|nr:glycerol-3-phosphate dehydrogenase [Gammaproteobacteria bacterium]
MSKPRDEFDLVVIGGGINGAGIARDAALRGLRVCLLEQHDLCHATSRWSSRLIHGGLRYLEYAELGLVRESLRERELLLHLAPHLVKPLPMLVPIYRGARRGRFLIGAGMRLYELLSIGKSLPGYRMLTVPDAVERAPAIETNGLRGAAHYYDAQVTFPERLVVENAVSAAAAGAAIRSYHRVESLRPGPGQAITLGCTNRIHDRALEIRGRVVVNAAGPWVDHVLDGLDRELPGLIGGTKGSHLVIREFTGSPKTACYIEAESDGRPYFVIPWNRLLLIGTTDIRCSGNPDDVTADPDELDYLLTETNRVFPMAQLGRDDVLYHYTGVRPLPRRPKGSEGAITRRHLLRDHSPQCPGLFSVIGGKLTTFRNLAEEVVDQVQALAGHANATCSTDSMPLPGAEQSLDEVAAELNHCSSLSNGAREHLLAVYGSRAGQVAVLAESHPDLAREIDPWSHAIAAEIVFALEHELATCLADVLLRRCMVGLSPDLGRQGFERALEVAASELGWDAARASAERAEYNNEISKLRELLD